MNPADLVAECQALILDFDGPVCSVFYTQSSSSVAQKLREELFGIGWSVEDVPDTADPLALLRHVAGISIGDAQLLDSILVERELHASSGAPPTDGLQELLDRVANGGKLTAVASNNSAEAVRTWLAANEFDRMIRDVQGRDPNRLLRMKPDPWPLDNVISNLGLESARCVFVGDSLNDADAARAAGVPFIPLADKPKKKKMFEDLGHRPIESMRELIRAQPDPVEIVTVRAENVGMGNGRTELHGPPQLLIFDGDDTLWETELLYDAARNLAAEVVHQNGVDPEMWTKRQKEIDLENVKTMGLTPARFPTSSVEAFVELAPVDGADQRIRKLVWDAAATVFSSSAPIVPKVLETLSVLAERHTLVLLTKGDREVQHARIQDHAIVEAFDGVLIVDRKTELTFGGICDAYGFSRSDGWSIGNSLPSDILPANAAGLRTIWLDTHVWEHERVHDSVPERTIELNDIGAVVGVVNGITGGVDVEEVVR